MLSYTLRVKTVLTVLFTTRKKIHEKSKGHRDIKIRSLKNYTIELYQEALKNIDFPNYETFTNMNDAYKDFIEKIMLVINKMAPIKTICAKRHTEEWFDGEVLESILPLPGPGGHICPPLLFDSEYYFF